MTETAGKTAEKAATGGSVFSELLTHLQSSRAQSLFARVEELRTRLFHLLILGFVLVGISFLFAKDIFSVLKAPLIEALPKQKEVLHFTGPLEVMMAYMKVSFLISATLLAPAAFFQGWRYLGPAMPEAQRKYVLPFVGASTALFATGVVFSFFVMLPMGLKWLVGFGAGQATAVITVDEYISLVSFMLLAFGVAFQLPLVVIILERLGIVSEQMLTKNRGGILVGILILAAVLAPSPDPFSQLAMAAPMYLLFEAAILVIRRLKKLEAAVQAKP